MPYLNLMDRPVSLLREPDPRRETRLLLSFSEGAAEILRGIRERLSQVLSQPGKELRVDLPENWTLYFKVNAADNRLLLAHPEPEAWVGTVSLLAEEMERLINGLDYLSANVEKGENGHHQITLAEDVPVNEFSNLNVAFEVRI